MPDINANALTIVIKGDAAQFTRTITQVEAGIKRAQNTMRNFGHTGVTNVQAISASLRLAEGNMNNMLRAGERFIALSPGLSSVAKAIFPLVGGVAVGSIFARLGKDAYDLIERIKQVPQALQQGFQSLSLSQRTAIDALNITNDKLAIEIAKLEHKPVNNAKLAIDEMREAADKLAQSLQTDNEHLNLLIQRNQVTAWQMLTSRAITGKGEARTADITGTVTYYENKFSDLGYQYSSAIRAGNKSLADSLKEQIDAARLSARKYVQDALHRLRASQQQV